jgi:hypothetical protein
MGGVIPSALKGAVTGAGSGMKSGIADYKKSVEPAPTTAEVSQASATDAAGIKRRRRGRSQTILTGSSGVQEGATLGSPTLLG